MTSVAQLLSEPVLTSASVVAGGAGVDRAVDDVVMYASARDIPTADGAAGALVVCGEADVTPAYKIDALVRRADHLGASAVLVIAAHGHPLLSGIRLADRLGLPVLWIVQEDPFPLAVELAVRVRTPHVTRADALLRVPEALATAKDLDAITLRTAALAETSVAVLTADGSRIAGDAAGDSEIRFDLAVAQRGDRVVAQPVVLPQASAAGAWLVAVVDGFDGMRRTIVADILALAEPYVRAWFVGEAARLDRDAVFLAHLLNSVIGEADDPSRDVIEKAASVGWRLQEWHTGIYVVTDDPRAPSDRDSTAAQLRRELARHDIRLGGMADHSGGWAMWVTDRAEPSADDVRALVRGLRLALADLPREWGLVVGVGRHHRGSRGLADTLAEARNAGYLARSREFRPSVDHTDELGVAQLLATLQQSDVTRAFAESALAPISDPASSHLLATLTAYLQNGGSVVFTAQALNVHRNTVTARLQQLRDRLGVDLDDASLRLALQMAVRAIDAGPSHPPAP
ncbi:PucR family transcriptional regulator [Microbacterium sp. ASV49]|uniref:Helix-turn-helix domain-containing protein n=1 Tax=Microbacterium candidum TaxID=3041922 RepID=A0ABT7MW41_9MICO|nr:helix-turn-helix domain-containing protein [Microbacterium sp. ASV49]MDL9978665.1 helix-turn-helix domain-containing protein [Microbacterium sp. ASV49]